MRQAAVDIDDRAGRVRHVAPHQRRDRAPDIVGLTPAAARAPGRRRCAGRRRRVTPAVMSVAMIPGRTSKTGMPCSARRAAKRRAAIDSPALLTQYSPRLGEAISADTEVMNTIAARNAGSARRCIDLIARDRLGEEVRPLQVRAEQLLEAVLGRFEQVGAHARRAAGVVDERVDRAERARPRRRCGARSSRLRRDRRAGSATSAPAAAQLVERRRATSDSGRVPPSARFQPSRGERARDAEADAARAAGDERRASWTVQPFASAIAVTSRPEERQVRPALGEPLHVQRRLAQVVVAPLARLAARRSRARRHVVPSVRPVIDRVQQQTLMAGVGAQVRPGRRTACRGRCRPACS